MADDPVRQVAAVRPAGDAEPLRVGQAVGDERVDAGEDVAHRARAPVAVVGVVERLAVALGAARVAVEDADPGRGEDLELPDRRPAVERVRAAVDLDDERPGPTPAGEEPALDVAAVDRHVALDRLAQGELAEDVGVERRSGGAAWMLADPPASSSQRSGGSVGVERR